MRWFGCYIPPTFTAVLQIVLISCNRHFPVLRFQPDKGFAGTDRGQRRDGPVQFEKEEEDPFGLDKFLTEAKKGKRPLDEPSRSRYYIPHTLMIIDRLICV